MNTSRNSRKDARSNPSSDTENVDDIAADLSPSERMGLNAAHRFAGHHRGRGSTRAALASILLGFELVVIFLTGMTMFGLRVFQPPELGIWSGVALCALTVVALMCMRTRAGIFLGWIVQLLLLAGALLLPGIAIVALIFIALYAFACVKGAQIDRMRAAAERL